MIVLGLALHLTDGRADIGDPVTWPASSEGLRYTELSSDGWRAAAVAGGEDPAAAQAAADRVTAAYTGAGPAS
jgi:hypothetical protein